MSLIVTVAGGPVDSLCSGLLDELVAHRLITEGFAVEQLTLRNLPSRELLHHLVDAPALREAVNLVARADALVISTPLFHGIHAGLLKAFLDVLPPLGLSGKVVLPLSTGAGALAGESTLRPLLVALGTRRVVGGLSVPDRLLVGGAWADGASLLDHDLERQLRMAVDEFAVVVRRGQRGIIDETLAYCRESSVES